MMGPSMTRSSFFEGPEKKLEAVVTPDFPPLRSLGDDVWRGIVESAGAKVVSVLRTEHCDAYILSESSLFVFDDWFVLITCGQTTLVDAVPQILRSIPAESIAFLVYERKSEHFPEHQSTSFHEDARRLQTMLPGRALCFGDEHGRYVQMFHTTRPYTPETNDPTLEVLMHEIDKDVAQQFISSHVSSGTSIAVSSGIDAILPGFTTSEHVFNPTGYSLNAVKGEEYYALHVTPEATGSYVSFETNCDFRGHLGGLVGSIIKLFRPLTFDVVTFVPESEPELLVAGYELGNHVVHALGGYQVSYFHYFAPPSALRSARELEL
ncbi:MAG: adenosylmethionine decarboxylase [Deltaproteobacteria bacterium]|nr:MAG: adenosylmethionine decarboxylase [Deltaproteobacteria bacterium]